MVATVAVILLIAAVAVSAAFWVNYSRFQAETKDAQTIAAMVAAEREKANPKKKEKPQKEPSQRQVELTQAGIDMPLWSWYLLKAAAVVFAVMCAQVVFRSPIIDAIVGVLAFSLFGIFKKRRAEASMVYFGEQLAAALPQVASNMRAGMTVDRALKAVGDHMDEPLKSELARANARLSYGDRLDQALQDCAIRTGSPDLRIVATAVAMQQDSGGDLAEVLDRIAAKIRSKLSLRRHIKSVTSSARASRAILIAMPWVAMLITTFSAENALEFWRSTPGVVVICVVVLLEFIGAKVMAKVMTLKID